MEVFLENYKDSIRKVREELLKLPMPKITRELFDIYEHTGNRLKYEDVYFARRRYLSIFAINSILYENIEDIKKLENIICDICEEECWALPPHVDKGKVNWQITVDLFAAETAFYLADICNRLKDRLCNDVISKAREEVFRRVLDPYLEAEREYAWWERCDMNWNAVCNCSVGIAGICLIDDEAVKAKLIDRICENIEHYIDGFGEDGVCLEGLSYYNYGMYFLIWFDEYLREYSEGKRTVLCGDKMMKIVQFLPISFLPGGYTIPFSDGSDKECFRAGLVMYLANYFTGIGIPSTSMSADIDSDACYRYAFMYGDIYFTEKYLRNIYGVNMAYCKVMPQAQWAVMVNESRDALVVKGGHNAEPHNHNDVGSFVYIADGHMILCDIGAGEYTKDYFGDKRYTYINCSSLGHNVPIVDEEGQKAGRQYACERFEQICDNQIELSIHSAYDFDNDESITRRISFDKLNGALRLQDVFKLREGRHIKENFVTKTEPHIVEEGFVIKIGDKNYLLQVKDAMNKYILKEAYKDHAGNEQHLWRITWDVIGENATLYIKK